MIDDLRAMAIFAETIRQGSFSRAAKLLSLSPSVVSYHITQLEARLGTALIYRSTRKLSLTHEGEVLYQNCLDMLAAAELGLNRISSNQEDPSGKLTLTLPAGLIRAPISQKIAEFSKQYRNIELNVMYTDERQDLIAHGIDLAIRAGSMEDSALKSRRVGQVERKLVCSRDYWAQQSTPTHPLDLAEWKWINLAMLPQYRILVDTDQNRVEIHYHSQLTVDSVEAATQFCMSGLGLSTPPDFLVDETLASGLLIEVFPEWGVEPMPLFAAWPANITESTNTRRLLDYLLNPAE